MRLLKPDEYYASVLCIDPKRLVSRGFSAVLLDLDNTLQPRGAREVPAEVAAWVARLKACGLKVCIVSNTRQERVRTAARLLGTDLVEYALKPLSKGYLEACELLDVRPSQAVMIGDQSYTDILGAHLVGMEALLVTPLSTQDLWHTKILRNVDRFAVRGMKPQDGTGQRV